MLVPSPGKANVSIHHALSDAGVLLMAGSSFDCFSRVVFLFQDGGSVGKHVLVAAFGTRLSAEASCALASWTWDGARL